MHPKRAVLYGRVSTGKQALYGVSLETQQELARQRCEREGWTLTDTYIDVMTGKSPRRPGILKLLDDARHRRFDVAIFYRIDRGGRTARFWHGELLATLDDYNVGLVSLTQDIDATTSDGRFMLGQHILLAEKESADISRRVADNMRTLAARGRWVAGGRIPYGYKLIPGHMTAEGVRVPGRLVIEPGEAEVVRHIFDRFIATRSIMGVVTELNESGHRSRRGTLWRKDTIRIILGNAVYVGAIVYGKFKEQGPTRRRVKQPREAWVAVKDAHEPILEVDTFDAAAAILRDNEGKAPRQKQAEGINPWSGLLFCAACGRRMNRRKVSTKPGPYSHAYICASYTHSGKSACPDYAYINAHTLESDVPPALDSRARQVRVVLDAAAEHTATKAPRRKGPDPARRIAELEATKGRAIEAYVMAPASFSAERRDTVIRECDEQITALMAQVQVDAPPVRPALPADFLDLWGGIEPAQQGPLLRSLVEKIEVSHSTYRVNLHPIGEPQWDAPLVFPVPRRQSR